MAVGNPKTSTDSKHRTTDTRSRQQANSNQYRLGRRGTRISQQLRTGDSIQIKDNSPEYGPDIQRRVFRIGV
jgi:hypothetical protein